MSAQEFSGTIVRDEFGPGAYLLEVVGGRRYGLRGFPDELRVEGLAVRIRGRLRDDLLGASMSVDRVLEVEQAERA